MREILLAMAALIMGACTTTSDISEPLPAEAVVRWHSIHTGALVCSGVLPPELAARVAASGAARHPDLTEATVWAADTPEFQECVEHNAAVRARWSSPALSHALSFDARRD